MQTVSKAYKNSMQATAATLIRNRGYIKVVIGIINSDAQDNVQVGEENEFTYFADAKKPFDGYTVDKVYATAEQDFSHVDGTMYFLPKESSGLTLYNNGLVTESLLGSIYISFGGVTGLDIKGLTIDFGEYYPTDFTIQNDSEIRSYNGNDKRYWTTEDVWDGTSFFVITPSAMVDGQSRLRIYSFQCGIANTFTNAEIRSFTQKEVVSSITDTVPSVDVTLEVDNQNLYYSPDNPDSALAFMEIGQEMKTSFGYDVDGLGNIEWLEPKTSYLKTWSADDSKAKFTATDQFGYMTEKYYKGMYREQGISLYDLAVDVLADMGVTDEREYFVDPYLRTISIQNPMPVVKHSEALQLIANAGRCVLYEDRAQKIHIQSSFAPDMAASANNQTEYSKIDNLLKDTDKQGYAEASEDYSVVDGSLFFLPENESFLETGYVSGSIFLVTEDGEEQWDGEIPKITITLEAATVVFGLLIRFRNVYPQEFRIITYYDGAQVADMDVTDIEDTEWTTYEQFALFDKMEIIFTRGPQNSRVFVDSILIGGITDYTIGRNDMLASPTATRKSKIKSISVVRTLYAPSAEETTKDLKTETLTLSEDTEHTVEFSNASYGLEARIVLEKDADGNEIPVQYTVEILEYSNFYARLRFTGFSAETTFKYAVSGYEYAVTESNYTVTHNSNGDVEEWGNPLISTTEHAKDLEEWLASYFLGDVDYQISWRGDPRTDANDLFYLELKDRPKTLIRAYQNELKFGGAWSGTLKARKAVMSWQ